MLIGQNLVELLWCADSHQLEVGELQVPVHLAAVTGSNAWTISCQMEIPAAHLVNKYVAAQGPLPHTCAQFWQVVWDQKLSLIVMLTTLTERGRVSGLISRQVRVTLCSAGTWTWELEKALLKCHPVQPPLRPVNLYRAPDGQLQGWETQPSSFPLAGLSELSNDQAAPPIPALDLLQQAGRRFPLPHLPQNSCVSCDLTHPGHVLVLRRAV